MDDIKVKVLAAIFLSTSIVVCIYLLYLCITMWAAGNILGSLIALGFLLSIVIFIAIL